MSDELKKHAPLPWRAFDRSGVVCIYDAKGREIIGWSGFDSSTVPPNSRAHFAHMIVAAVNAMGKSQEAADVVPTTPQPERKAR